MHRTHEIRASGASGDRAIAALAGCQHGVVALSQLQVLGLGRGAVATRVSSGRLHRLYRGVYAVGHSSVSSRGRLMAAVLACGPDAVASHRSAAALWGIRRSAATKVEVTAIDRRGQHGITLHRVRRLDAEDRTIRDGIPVTTVARTLLDGAAVLTPRHLVTAIEDSERLRLFDLRARAFLDFCRDASLPLPATNVSVCGYEVDAAWIKQKVIVELDSYAFHGTRGAFERDRVRDAVLQENEFRPLRVTHRRLTEEPRELERVLRRFLAL